MKKIIILKFGGTSVSTAERLQTIVEIVRRQRKYQLLVVVSAIRGVTDLLLTAVKVSDNRQQIIVDEIRRIHVHLAESILQKIYLKTFIVYLDEQLTKLQSILKKRRPSNQTTDMVISFGEILSSFLISEVLKQYGLPSQQVIATQIIVTDNIFGRAEFLPGVTKQRSKEIIFPLIKNNKIPVITGFIAETKNHEITTLGRGGSDYTAAILGYALSADEIQIWTDVDGIYSADPRVIIDAKLLTHVSYREASELAAFGAKVLHPRTIRPAITAHIPVRVLNTLHPESAGTLIRDSEKAHRVVGIASKPSVTLVNIFATDMLLSKGFLSRVFTIFAQHNISVDLVSVSEVSVSITLDNDENLREAIKELSTFCTVTIKRDVGVISLIGDGILTIPHILQTIFSHLDKASIPVQMISLGATDINISLVLPKEYISQALLLLHTVLIAKQEKINEQSEISSTFLSAREEHV